MGGLVEHKTSEHSSPLEDTMGGFDILGNNSNVSGGPEKINERDRRPRINN